MISLMSTWSPWHDNTLFWFLGSCYAIAVGKDGYHGMNVAIKSRYCGINVTLLLHIKVGINDLTDVNLIPLARAANSLRGWQLSSYNGLSLYTIVKIITSLCAIVKIIPSYTPSSGSSRWLGLSYSLFIRHRQDHPLIIRHRQDHQDD